MLVPKDSIAHFRIKLARIPGRKVRTAQKHRRDRLKLISYAHETCFCNRLSIKLSSATLVHQANIC